jgi:hypothetical protein
MSALNALRFTTVFLFVFPLLASGCASTGAVRRSAAGPAWIYETELVFPEERYLSALGYGSGREAAEKNALGSLTAIFGQAVEGKNLARYRYYEAADSALIDMKEFSEIDNAVKVSYGQEKLVGAEIKDTWFDGKNAYYAIAVMDKLKCALLYGDLIETNERAIQKLTGKNPVYAPPAEGDSLEMAIRYGMASKLAEANEAFGNILKVLNPAAASLGGNEISKAIDLQIAQGEIIRRIPIGITVKGDLEGRIAAAFTGVISGMGFRKGGAEERYLLEVNFSIEDAELPNNKNKFVRYTLSAELFDRSKAQAFFSWSANGREGHVTRKEAENRALRAAEAEIQKSYAETFSTWLTSLGG